MLMRWGMAPLCHQEQIRRISRAIGLKLIKNLQTLTREVVEGQGW
jgi:hypothetical protein